MGVWTALRENGVDYQLVTGTSIGALNGALMAQEDYEPAEELWRTLTIDKVMENGINLERSIEGMWNQKAELLPFLKKYLEFRGADITPLKQLIGRVIDETRLRNSPIEFGLVTVGFPSLTAYELTRDDIPQGQFPNFLLASASCFPAFPMCKIEGKFYIDGGYYDNFPINLALKMGAEAIVGVDLSYPPAYPEYLDKSDITYISPSWDLGSFLFFDPAVMEQNTRLGYNDTQKAYGRCFGYRYTFQSENIASVYLDAGERLYNLITQLESRLSEPRKRTVLRNGKKPVTDCIAGKTNRFSPSPFHYLIRSMECCAEFLELDHLKRYRLSEFIGQLQWNIGKLPFRNCERHFSHLRSIRLPTELISSIDQISREERLACVYRKLLSPDLSEDDMEFFAAALPQELTALLGLACLQKKQFPI